MTDYPSLPEQGKNLAKFAFELVKNAMQSDALFVSDEVKEERLTICRACEYYDEEQFRCKHCGCWLESKSRFALDSCPIDKWVESDTDWMNGKYDEVLEILEDPEKLKKPEPIVMNETGPTDESKGPIFPRNPELNAEYTWNEMTWVWNGIAWVP